MENAKYYVRPLEKGLRFEVEVPGSKSITNRALLLAALSKGKTILRGALFSQDSRVFVEALGSLGYQVEVNENKKTISLEGDLYKVVGAQRKVYVGSAGTAARFLTAMLALSGGVFEVTSSEQMKRRPMRPLLEALTSLGVEFEYLEEPYAFPFRILGRKESETATIPEVELNIDESSQYLSALLMAGVFCKKGLQIHLVGKRSAKSYVGITIKMMKSFGCQVDEIDENTYRVNPDSGYLGRDYQIEPDVSAACYFYGIAALIGGEGKVRHVSLDSMQGDIRFLSLLSKMGCHVMEEGDGVVVRGSSTGVLLGVDVDMGDYSDQAATLAAMAPFLKGKTEISGVEHIRRQESNRILGIVTELNRVGVEAVETKDGVIIIPGEVKPAEIVTYEDHRMAMAFSLLGCMVEGIVIQDPGCVAKTFEEYFQVLEQIRPIDKS